MLFVGQIVVYEIVAISELREPSHFGQLVLCKGLSSCPVVHFS